MQNVNQMKFNEELGSLIRNLRIRHQTSMNELANHIGVSFQQIQKYEKGVNQLSAYRLCQIANALNDSPERLLQQVQNTCRSYSDTESSILHYFRQLPDTTHQHIILQLLQMLASRC